MTLMLRSRRDDARHESAAIMREPGKEKAGAVLRAVPAYTYSRCCPSGRHGDTFVGPTARDCGMTVINADSRGFFSSIFFHSRIDRLIRTSMMPTLLINASARQGYQRVLIAVDFSEKAKKAARTALSACPAAQVVFLHAFRVPDEERAREAGASDAAIIDGRMRTWEAAKARLQRFVDDVGATRRLVSCVVHHGAPAPVICNYAGRMRADLIVIGKPAQSRMKNVFSGSMVRRLLTRTSSDVLVAAAATEGLEESGVPHGRARHSFR